MGSEGPAKRPFCPSCVKPSRLCLCARMKVPPLGNSIAVTILQHSQERNHALNSTRIAAIGLKNLTVATVSDVHFEAQFLIRLLKPALQTPTAALEAKSDFYRCLDNTGKLGFDRSFESQESQKPVAERNLKAPTVGAKLRNGKEEISDFEQILVSTAETKNSMIATGAKCSSANDFNGKSDNVNLEIHQNHIQKQPDIDMVSILPTVKEATSDTQTAITRQKHLSKSDFGQIGTAPTGEEQPAITATIAKCGFTCSLTHLQTPQTHLEKPDFDQLLASRIGQEARANGFVVKMLQKRQLNGSMELEEYQEYEVVIPPCSALLFPAKESIGIEAVDFEVKHLVVLDGTWRKAKRMYHENPWLRLLPHLKLEPSNMSLYNEVRHQPKAGCLSTIESIVYALKALGDDLEGLDYLLDVFVSMIGDQRRCKDEKLSKISPP